jgi:hypothetical protein
MEKSAQRFRQNAHRFPENAERFSAYTPVSHTRVPLLPSGVAKWWLRDGKVEGLGCPITCANAHAQGVQDLSVECGSIFMKRSISQRPIIILSLCTKAFPKI